MINEVLEAIRARLTGVANLYSTKLTKGVAFKPSLPIVSVTSVRGSGTKLRLAVSVVVKHPDNVTLHQQIEGVFLALNNFRFNDGVVLLDNGEINAGSDGFYALMLFQYTALVNLPTSLLESALLGETATTFNENCEVMTSE